MKVRVHLPSMLRAECGVAELDIEASTVREVLDAISVVRPDVYRCVCDETHSLRRHINLFVNEQMVSRDLDSESKLKPGDEVFIFTAVSGG